MGQRNRHVSVGDTAKNNSKLDSSHGAGGDNLQRHAARPLKNEWILLQIYRNY